MCQARTRASPRTNQRHSLTSRSHCSQGPQIIVCLVSLASEPTTLLWMYRYVVADDILSLCRALEVPHPLPSWGSAISPLLFGFKNGNKSLLRTASIVMREYLAPITSKPEASTDSASSVLPFRLSDLPFPTWLLLISQLSLTLPSLSPPPSAPFGSRYCNNASNVCENTH